MRHHPRSSACANLVVLLLDHRLSSLAPHRTPLASSCDTVSIPFVNRSPLTRTRTLYDAITSRRAWGCGTDRYTWMDATLRELSQLVKEVNPAARRPHTRIAFSALVRDRKGVASLRELGVVANGQTVGSATPQSDCVPAIADLRNPGWFQHPCCTHAHNQHLPHSPTSFSQSPCLLTLPCTSSMA